MPRPKRYLRLLSLLMAAGLLCGCAAVLEGPGRREPGAEYLPQNRSMELIDQLDRLNQTLATFKGIGKVNIAADGQRRSARIVWAGMAPDKLRIEILGLPGQPTASLALNGEWIYFDPHSPDRFYKRKLGDDSLQPILAIAITPADIIEILRGRLPVRDHDTTSLFKPPGEKGWILQLERRWWGVREKIYLNNSLDDVRRIEIFSNGGALTYRVDFDRIESVNGYRLPHHLVVSNDDGDRFELDISSYQTNIAVDPATFVLTARS